MVMLGAGDSDPASETERALGKEPRWVRAWGPRGGPSTTRPGRCAPQGVRREGAPAWAPLTPRPQLKSSTPAEAVARGGPPALPEDLLEWGAAEADEQP